jgi:hypothetical protein
MQIIQNEAETKAKAKATATAPQQSGWSSCHSCYCYHLEEFMN